jgi:hypothetical protein
VLERAPQPVELPDDEGVAGPEEGERFGESGAFVLCIAGDVGSAHSPDLSFRSGARGLVGCELHA